ncbi:unnamed protein product [Soboliphyme baturini]|uniref:Uncharacterized protein n=1 Tax=Soboliphyme baturini TaxID=241478 RepID=A0A183JAF5_9BILA|nr:unnamed protein product [Soboliphyme baturini]
MAEILSVSQQKGDISFHAPKVSASEATNGPASTERERDNADTKTVDNSSGHLVKSPISSVQSSGQHSLHSESKWTSFDESEQEDSSLE